MTADGQAPAAPGRGPRPYDQEREDEPIFPTIKWVPPPQPPAKPLTPEEVEDARYVIATQMSTVPADGNIGVEGAWERAEKVHLDGGRRAHDRLDGPSGFPHLQSFAKGAWRRGRR